MTAGKKEKNRVVKRIVLEMPKPDTKSNIPNEIADYDVSEVKHNISDNVMKETGTKNKTSNTSDKNKTKSKKNDIDDLFSGLDELALDDDEDDFESSSEMWEKDAMRRFSRY